MLVVYSSLETIVLQPAPSISVRLSPRAPKIGVRYVS